MIACIGVPIYKQTLNPLEIISLERLFAIEKEHKIFFITFPQLDTDFYSKYLRNQKNLDITYFNQKYFSSIDGYNKLLLSSHFYKRFDRFEYILIYQLDALIIKDELNHWCSRDYDYIGAPWFDIETKYSFYQKLCNSSNAIFRWIKRKVDFNKGQKIFVGNGGFSLRKIKTFKSVSKWLPFIEPNLFKYKINEDIVWSILVPKYFRNFKIPCREEALFFFN
jgi:hypothetical protein